MFMQEAGIPSLTQERYLLETRGRGAGRHWHVDDEALIRAYRYASSTAPKTAESHASLLRQLGNWLRANPEADGRPRPTLPALCAELFESQRPARKNPHVRAYRDAVGMRSSAGKNTPSALDALVRGDTTRKRQPVQIDDEALIRRYQQTSATLRRTALTHASLLRQLASWLRTHPEESGQPRPTLAELRTVLFLSRQAARENRHLQAFRDAVGPQSSAGQNVASALNALVHGNTTRKSRRARVDEVASVKARRLAPVTAE
ncbi:hypothetical protein K7N18_15905 [Burkholderia arboris]|uniref:hypothetical protein n=1 Tax=Burkholderia arboris TaxID=488730 RepID=UPI001CA39713|nr:hypothetical protein [Burkholderia arboris]MBY8606318.1 hypothetical protein [Burkholderia arboris]